MRRMITMSGLLGVMYAGYRLLVRGALTLDLGIGRRVRPLGPIQRTIRAPREIVFDVIAAPYLGRTPRAIQDKLRVWERSEHMVLAEHLTRTARTTTATLETVRFERPARVSFRLVRGPVPHVTEAFELHDNDEQTTLLYTGELGTDLWSLGARWGEKVAALWEHTVAASLDQITAEAERRARV